MQKIENIPLSKTRTSIHLYGTSFFAAAYGYLEVRKDHRCLIVACITNDYFNFLRLFSYRQKCLERLSNDCLFVISRDDNTYASRVHNRLFFRSSNVSISDSSGSSWCVISSLRSISMVSPSTLFVLHSRSRNMSGISLFNPIR